MGLNNITIFTRQVYENQSTHTLIRITFQGLHAVRVTTGSNNPSAVIYSVFSYVPYSPYRPRKITRWTKATLSAPRRVTNRPPGPKMCGRASLGGNSVDTQSHSELAKPPVGFGNTALTLNSVRILTDGVGFAGFASSKRNTHLTARLLAAPRTRKIISFSNTSYGIRPASASLQRTSSRRPPRRVLPTSSN